MGKKEDIFGDDAMNGLNELLMSKDTEDKVASELKQEQDKNVELSKELTHLKTKLDMFNKEITEKSQEFAKLKITMEKDAELKANIQKQLDDITKRHEELVEEARQLKKSILTKDDAITTKDKQIIDKDEQIKGLTAKINEISSRMEANSGKAGEFQGQIVSMQQENEALKLKEKDLMTKLSDLEVKHEKLKERFRDSGDSVLGTTMELEKIKADVEKKDEEIKELQGKLGSILTGGSGIITTREHLSQILREKVGTAHRSIRICVPSISIIEEMGILPLIQQLPRTVVINIAGDIKATDEHIILDLKPRGIIFTQYDQKDRWVMNRDSEDALIALEKDDGNIVGFFTNETRIVTMLNSAINEPWVRGIKI